MIKADNERMRRIESAMKNEGQASWSLLGNIAAKKQLLILKVNQDEENCRKRQENILADKLRRSLLLNEQMNCKN